ncbi:universal stress protein [Psychroserpens sp.]|uniref:universal stress protein n=1 Tax=Psychroserpens sp. TaxID=2020870 RepID=UPI00385F66FE
MKKILLPTDFSNNSWNAIVYALQLYKDEKCNFILLHTYTPTYYQLEYMETSSRAFQVGEAIKETSRKELDDLLKKINENFENPKHTFKKISSFNTLTAEINTLYERGVMDLIIMGTKGASGLKGILFGSNTIHILNSVKCPVIAVPSNFEYESPKEILFPSDYEVEFKDSQLQPLLDLAKAHHSRLNILHVSHEIHLSENQIKNRNILDLYFEPIAPLFHNIKNENVAEAIVDFQLKTTFNLLVMINNKHSFFENLFFKSKVNQIGFHLNTPFLVIPSKK